MIHQGDLSDVLPTLAAGSVDACVTDPPYDLTANKRGGSGEASLNLHSPAGRSRITTGGGFMGKEWDGQGVAFKPDTWAAVLRVLKPGAHLIACGGTRTFHRMTCAIEDAGFEIRDCLSWLYGQGFPKSLNVGDGLGTALKPSWEPCVLARKPFKGTVAGNVAAHGTGALNVDACRIAHNEECREMKAQTTGHDFYRQAGRYSDVLELKPSGRWPANVILDEAAAALLDEQSGELVSGARDGDDAIVPRNCYQPGRLGGHSEARTGGASRFYYVAKPSREERDYGTARNSHPTVKPIELMRWLVRLVTPVGGTVLDPFMGSGTTGMACAYEQRGFIGVERDAEYIAIAQRRIAACVPLFAATADPEVGPAAASQPSLFAEVDL